MASRAIISHPAFRTVTSHAAGFLRQQNIFRFFAFANLVAMDAVHRQMFGVIEPAADKPAVGDDRLGNFGGQFTARRHFVAIDATGIKRASIGRFFLGAEENVSFQNFSIAEFSAQPAHLFLHKLVQRALFVDAILAAEVGILDFHAAKKGAHGLRFSVGQLQARIMFVELKRVTFATIFLKRNALVRRTGRVGLVTIGARKHGAIRFAGNFREMKAVIEFESVWVL